VEERLDDPIPGPCGPEPEVCFDLETCGFAGTPLFLVGLLVREPEGLRLTQILARHYGEERAVVAETLERLHRFPNWLSFNGKAYDAPFLAGRAGHHGVAMANPERHRDLLHEARRRYRHELPDCRLQTLESLVLKRFRAGDVPGSEIPALYHDAVKQGRPERLRSVLDHNRHDLITLALLAAHLDETDERRTGVGLTVRAGQG
jgi:uncharacterized protein YprB with RNaseH-like and TPR domain